MLALVTGICSCDVEAPEETVTETYEETVQTTTEATETTETQPTELLAPIIVETEPPRIPFTLHDRSIAEENDEDFIGILDDLVNSYEHPDQSYDDDINERLDQIRDVSEEDYALAVNIIYNWNALFMDPGYPVIVDGTEEAQTGLESSGILNSREQAIVILGYELDNGQMQPELIGRLNAAAALAQAYPETLIVCSGGATGPNNPQGNTEAGLMRDYLVDECGIDPLRIFIDERAQTTADNAVYTFDILEEQGVHQMTIVTATYHIRWGEMVYRTVGYLCEVQQEYVIDSIANYCFEAEPTVYVYRAGHRFAARQIAEILGLSQNEVENLPSPFDY